MTAIYWISCLRIKSINCDILNYLCQNNVHKMTAINGLLISGKSPYTDSNILDCLSRDRVLKLTAVYWIAYLGIKSIISIAPEFQLPSFNPFIFRISIFISFTV